VLWSFTEAKPEEKPKYRMSTSSTGSYTCQPKTIGESGYWIIIPNNNKIFIGKISKHPLLIFRQERE
jgi:hypothetical protein